MDISKPHHLVVVFSDREFVLVPGDTLNYDFGDGKTLHLDLDSVNSDRIMVRLTNVTDIKESIAARIVSLVSEIEWFKSRLDTYK